MDRFLIPMESSTFKSIHLCINPAFLPMTMKFMKPENHVDSLDTMAQGRQLNCRPHFGNGFFLKCKIWMWLVLIVLGSPAFAVQTSIDLYIATDNSPDMCFWSVAGFSTNSMFWWECGI